MAVLNLVSKNDVREIEMSEDEFQLFITGWAHEEISKAYMKMPLCQRHVVNHMKKSKDYFCKGWVLFYQRFPELKHSRNTFTALYWQRVYVEKSA